MNADFKYMKVLVVEDDEHVANIIKVVLMAFCVEQVHVCTNYDDAVDYIKDHPLHCVFVDYMMLPVGGIKLINYIRWYDEPDVAKLPIILCTVYTDLEKVIEARDAGVSEILAKPITPMSIFHKTVAAVHKPRPFVTSPTFKGPDRRRRNLPWVGKVERRSSNKTAMGQVQQALRPGGSINA